MRKWLIRFLERIGLYQPSVQLINFLRAAKSFPQNWNKRRRYVTKRLHIPPLRLIYAVTGSFEVGWYVNSGKIHAECILEALAKNGLRLQDFEAVLDFGCGCGRILRNWNDFAGPKIYGADWNPRMIRWCKKNLGFAGFETNRLSPPLSFGGSQFDFIYAFSVFTHLSESLQQLWLEELLRVLRPNGHLLITTHGESYFSLLDDSEQERFRAGKLVVRHEYASGKNLCCAYHPPEYVQKTLAAGLVMDFIPAGGKIQDIYLLRKQ